MLHGESATACICTGWDRTLMVIAGILMAAAGLPHPVYVYVLKRCGAKGSRTEEGLGGCSSLPPNCS